MPNPQYNNNQYRSHNSRTSASAERFEIFGVATLVYALLFSVLMYRNFSSICSLVMTVMTVIFMSVCLERHEIKSEAAKGFLVDKASAFAKQRKLIPNYAGIILLGISVCFTADTFIIVMDNIGIFVLVITGLIRYFYDSSNLGFVRYGLTTLDMASSPVSSIDRYFTDYKLYKKSSEDRRRGVIGYVLIGLVIAVPLLFIMITLLSSADQIFGDAMETVFGIFMSWDIVWFVVFAWIVLVYVYGVIVQAPVINRHVRPDKQGEQEPIIAITAMGLLTLVYLIFSLVQILYLFMNNMTLPDNLTYAEYARQGFFQLLFVSVINVAMVIICHGIFRKSKVLNIVLTVMSACTYVMIASSAMRMIMYIKEYDLTYLRILVLVGLAMIACVLTGVIIRIYAERFPLVNFSLLCIMTIYIVFSFIKPVHIIAEYNLNISKIAEIDYDYIMDLGPDATEDFYQFITEHEAELNTYDGWSSYYFGERNFAAYYSVDKYFEKISDEYKEHGAIRGFNVSRYKANKYAEKYKRNNTYSNGYISEEY
jgi:hypothetical protein